MGKNDRGALEVEAGCRLAETIGGMPAGLGEGYMYVKRWLDTAGIDIDPCRDGTHQGGELDRLGRPLQRGRGMGMFDDIWPSWVVPGVIREMIPVNFKSWSGGSNTDLTSGGWDAENECPVAGTPLAAFEEMVAAGLLVGVCLLKEENGVLMMRRADAVRVYIESNERGLTYKPARGEEKGQDISIARLRISGSGKYKGRYRRVSIQWKHVPADLWIDSEWREFDPTAPWPVFGA